MKQYAKNPTHFAAECARRNGQCVIVRENIVFLDECKEHTAITYLQKKCGNVVITPDTANLGHALLYCTACERMADVINQLFQDHLDAPASLPQPAAEMTVGDLHRRRVDISYDDCKARVEGFSF